MFLDRIDDTGATVWRRTFLLTDRKYPGEANAPTTWKGGYLIAARMWSANGKSGKGDRPVLIKTDKGGYDGCLAAGGCVAKTPAECNDKDPCTVDWCHPTNGCQHHTVAGCK